MTENKQLVERIINEINNRISFLEEEISKITNIKGNSTYLEDLSKSMSNDVIEFASTFYNYSDDAMSEFSSKTEGVFEEENDVSYEQLIQETKNLYFLYEDGLLGTSAVEVQYRKAVECINKFRRMVERYNKRSVEKINNDLSLNEDDLLKFQEIQECFDENGIVKEIDNEDEFSREIYKLNLTSNEKIQFMFLLNDSNISMFKKKLNDSLNKKEIIQEILEVKPESKKFVVSEDVVARIDDLLNDSEVMNKVLAAIYDVDDKGLLVGIDEEEIEVTKEMVKDNIIERLELDEELEPEQAFDDIYRSITKDESLIKLENRLFNEKTVVYDMSKEEQLELLERAKIFYEYYKSLLVDVVVDVNNKHTYDNLIDAFTLSDENREAIYRNRILSNVNEFNLLVAYELGLILRVIDSVSKEDYGKVMSRIKELFDTYDNVYINDYIKVGEMPKEDTGHLFFIDSDCNISEENLFVEDVNFGSKKGIPKQYYPGLLSALKGIKERNTRDENYKQGKYVSEPILKELRVRFRDSNRTRVIYIPVGEKDAIILGARCRGYVESNQHEFSNRAKKMHKKLSLLIDLINERGEDYEQLVRANNIVEEEMYDALIPKNSGRLPVELTDRDLEMMLEIIEEELEEESNKVR